MRVKLHPTRSRVYEQLIKGLCPSKVAEELGVDPSTVHHHKTKLLQEEFIKPVKDTSPQLYCRGPRSNILDKALLEVPIGNDGGIVRPTDSSNPPCSTSDSIFVPTARAHANGRVIFSVNKKGDLHELRIPDRSGDRIRVSLFPKDPYLSHHGVEAWKTSLELSNGEKATLEYRESANGKWIYIWPPEKILIPEQFEKKEDALIAKSQEIANALQAYGGWRFGLPEFRGTVELAGRDERILELIRDDIRTMEGSELWVDESEGEREIETTDAKAARVIFELPRTIPRLEAQVNGVEDAVRFQGKQVYTLELRLDRVLGLLDKILKCEEKHTTAEVSRAERETLELAEKLAKGKERPPESTEAKPLDPWSEGVMYR